MHGRCLWNTPLLRKCKQGGWALSELNPTLSMGETHFSRASSPSPHQGLRVAKDIQNLVPWVVGGEEGGKRSSRKLLACLCHSDSSALPLSDKDGLTSPVIWPEQAPPLHRPWRVQGRSGSSLPGHQASDYFWKLNHDIKLLAPDFLSCYIQADTGGCAGLWLHLADHSLPCRMRWRRLGRSGGASCYHCATALSRAACW